MRKRITTIFFFLFIVSAFSQEISIESFGISGLSFPTEITHAGDERVFIAQKNGRIRLVDSEGVIINNFFLDITSLVSNIGEMGLLGLAFAPDYQESGKFYVHYNNLEGDTVIARYTISEDPNQANPDGTILLTIDNSAQNHKGGAIRFGPDGYLWISIGDDADWNNGQKIDTLKGKILRIDVSGESYTIPSDNPFVGIEGEDEIWAYGLRNPWKFSFDQETGDIWIGDVGSNLFEEINRSASTEAGLNYGWNCYEGNYEFPDSDCDGTEEMTFPISLYERAAGKCAIIGGYVYRGESYPNLIGKYFFADYCSAEIGWLDNEMNMTFTQTELNVIGTIGQDNYGNLYVASTNRVYKIVDESMGNTEENKLDINLYPNPTTDFLYITTNKPTDIISIYSAKGKLIQTIEGNTTQIDISTYPSGVYLIKVRSGNVSKTQKIIKK